MKLTRPLISFDCETTGTDTEKDWIVELGLVKLSPDGRREVIVQRFNPWIKIPPEATEVHGIRDQDVYEAPYFEHMAPFLIKHFDGCDLCGFNIVRFDIPILAAEFRRAGIEFPREGTRVVDAMAIYHRNEPRDLEAAAHFYLARDLEDAHSAGYDAEAALDVLLAQVERYDAPKEIADLEEYADPERATWLDSTGKFRFVDGEVVINFGKHKGTAIHKVKQSYLSWIVRSDFPLDAIAIAEGELSHRCAKGDGFTGKW